LTTNLLALLLFDHESRGDSGRESLTPVSNRKSKISNRKSPMTKNWLSLTKAAKLIGIHPSTLRRWSDDGRIPTSRTEGGHRRFERSVIEQYIAEQEEKKIAPPLPLAPPFLPSPQSPNLSPTWRDHFQGNNLQEVRHLGQRLLGLLMEYVTRQNEDKRFLAESRHIGRTYGRETAEAGLAMLDMVEAFLFFRSRFTEMTIQLPAFPRAGDDAEMRRLHSRIARFMNEVLLGAIEGYEQQEKG
jgi:excisionase family DNA binding protein